MKTCLPFLSICSARSAEARWPAFHVSMSTKTGLSSHSPVVAFFRGLFTAKPNLATLAPLGKTRTSGSRVSRPISSTRFKFAMTGLRDKTTERIQGTDQYTNVCDNKEARNRSIALSHAIAPWSSGLGGLLCQARGLHRQGVFVAGQRQHRLHQLRIDLQYQRSQ